MRNFHFTQPLAFTLSHVRSTVKLAFSRGLVSKGNEPRIVVRSLVVREIEHQQILSIQHCRIETRDGRSELSHGEQLPVRFEKDSGGTCRAGACDDCRERFPLG